MNGLNDKNSSFPTLVAVDSVLVLIQETIKYLAFSHSLRYRSSGRGNGQCPAEPRSSLSVGKSGFLGLGQDAEHLVGGGFIKGTVRTYQKGL